MNVTAFPICKKNVLPSYLLGLCQIFIPGFCSRQAAARQPPGSRRLIFSHLSMAEMPRYQSPCQKNIPNPANDETIFGSKVKPLEKIRQFFRDDPMVGPRPKITSRIFKVCKRNIFWAAIHQISPNSIHLLNQFGPISEEFAPLSLKAKRVDTWPFSNK